VLEGKGGLGSGRHGSVFHVLSLLSVLPRCSFGWRESKGWKNRGRTKEGVGVGQTALAMCSLRSSNNVNRMKVMKNTEVRQGPRWTWLLLCRCWRCAFLLDTGNVGLDLEAWTGVSDTGRVTRANLWTYAWGEDIISSDTEV